MKIERLLKLAAAGVTFLMFDFVSYVPPEVPIRRSEPSGSACWDPDHGHEVPLTMQRHAEGILKVIQAVKRQYPSVLIEVARSGEGRDAGFPPAVLPARLARFVR